ncbi:hypothetical protein [Bacillus sp. ISL-37]|jgi:hypothetical protein|uniref:hypothetical protein n=1 Tax=Bacillus sp. ISL-37 TaxID=2819123 RepID=UPI001BEC27BA|nr:hypothetical protein [Bacillus sp. ISL-37]MBT2683649.1 hypothetical protein [Bacillus sp. ISL-37]
MQKLFMLTFVLLLVFSGSVIASSSQNQNRNASPVEDYQGKSAFKQEGYLCWQCTKYTYHNGYRTCVSGVWLTTCPVMN